MNEKKANKGRAPGMSEITFPTTETKRSALKERAQKTNLSVSELCRRALAYQEERGWKEFSEAQPAQPFTDA
jgi:hypothetical protein